MADVLKLGIVDDHRLFRKGLITLIELAYPKCEILFEADNGLDLQQKLIKKNLPEESVPAILKTIWPRSRLATGPLKLW